MDTPERSKNSQIGTSIGKFEDSPVFNFLNNLSPIKPVKSIYITQTINPLSFASPPSVFSSLNLSSFTESRFLCRHQLSDPSKPEFSYDEWKTVNPDNDVLVTMNLDEQKENLDPRKCVNAGETSYGCSKLVVEFAESLECDSDIVNSSLSSLEAKHAGNLYQNNWDSLIADAPKIESYNISVDPHPATNFYRNVKNSMQNTHSLVGVVCGERDGEGSQDMQTHPRDEVIQNAGTGDTVADPSCSYSNEKMDYESLSGLYRGMRRRCLVFEMAGACRKHMEGGSASDSPFLLRSDGNASSNQQTVRSKTESDSSLLPEIGLHLNALATPNDIKTVNLGSSLSANLPPPTSSQDLLSNSSADSSLARDMDALKSGSLPMEDPSYGSESIANEDMNPISPKKRRRRLEQTGEGESCKRCNCKKSKCLKLYCECFAAGVYCVEPCACIDCFNKPVHEDTVLVTRKQIESRNPLAFAPKVIRTSDSGPETSDEFTSTPASARHKRGCNCKKSGCLKKYCECYQGGVGCSINCRCEGCKNAFGRKDSSGTSSTESQYKEHETDTTEKASLNTSLHKAANHYDLEQFMDSLPPATPLGTGRQPCHAFSKKRPPRATLPSILSTIQPSLSPVQRKLSPSFGTVEEGEMPHFLQGAGSPIKSSSPNSKRVSPPETEAASGLRSSRKLILRSIPAFPSLTSDQ